MKVLILGSKEFPIGTSDDKIPSGGMEMDVDKLVPELTKKGVEVHIITRKFNNNPVYEQRKNLHIYRVGWVKGTFFRNYSFNINSFFKALDIIKKEKIRVVHTVGVVASLVALLLKLLTGVRVLAEPRGVQMKIWWFPINLILGIQEMITYPLVNVVGVQSREQKISLERALHVKLNNTKIIPTGISHVKKLNPSKIRKEFRLKKEKVITFVGRFHPVKGIEYLLEAAKNLNNPKLKFMLVGDGIHMKQIKNFVKENNLESNVILTGWRKDVTDILAASDIYVLPSLSEGLPTSLLEAMAIGLPCIVTDIGLPIEHLKTGYVIPVKSPKSIEQAIILLLKEHRLRRELSKNSRKYLVGHHSMPVTAKKYMSIYEELAK